VIGLDLLKCLHLNDSKAARGSHLDRHQWIAEGTIGADAFRRIMRDPRLATVIKIIETPKLDDPVKHDRRMLRRLRAYARFSVRSAGTV
jgi:deoxyribonuclease-4